MSFISLASRESVFRGFDYFEKKRVISWKKIDKDKYEGYVSGSEKDPYFVTIDIEHPKKSMCNCPHAKGNVRVCKHKVALFFTIFPEEAEAFLNAIKEEERKDAEEVEQHYCEVEKFVNGLSLEQLRSRLTNAIIELESIHDDNDLWE